MISSVPRHAASHFLLLSLLLSMCSLNPSLAFSLTGWLWSCLLRSLYGHQALLFESLHFPQQELHALLLKTQTDLYHKIPALTKRNEKEFCG